MVAETSQLEGAEGRSPAGLAWARLRKKKLAMAALIILATLYSVGLFAPLVTGALGKDYSDQNLLKAQHGPDTENWFGTDRLGRDIFTRVIWGIQTTVIITLVTTLTGSLILGVTLGLMAGYFRGRIDTAVMRLGEVVSSFPDILLIILIAATLRPRIVELVRDFEDATFFSGLVSTGVVDFVVIGIALLPLSWFGTMRLVRGQVLALRESQFVEAAYSIGTSTPRLLVRHIFPNIVSPLIVTMSFGLGAIALSEVVLSFFGLGVQVGRPSLGRMIGETIGRTGSSGVSVLQNHPEQLIAPIAVVFLMIFCWNLLGDALNDVLNPRTK